MPLEYWKTQGTCASDTYVHMMLVDLKIDIFFEDSYKDEAKALCKVCPMRLRCLSAGLQKQPKSEYRESGLDVPPGIWGGQTQRERRRFLKNLDKQLESLPEHLRKQLPGVSDPNAA